jgi:tetratricopeptide (TPR) repeat protein
MRRAATWLALLFVLVVAGRAGAAAGTADQLMQKGLRSYAVGQYEDAIAAFRQGYELEPRAEFLYALGQAQRMQGDCRAAAASYRAYLRTSPPERSAATARENLKRCEAVIAATPPPQPPPVQPAPVVVQPGPAVVQNVPVERPHRRWYRDVAGDVLGGLGVAALASGAALWGVGEEGARSLVDATQYGQFAARAGQADTFDHERTAGIVTFAVGGTLMVAAIIRWSVVARR